jgi:hypothetical protein
MSKTLTACRNGTLAMPKTQRGADLQHRRLLRAYMKAYTGGGVFGYDTRTLAINEPEVYARLGHLERIFAITYLLSDETSPAD